MARIWRGEARLARSFLFIPLFLVSSLYAQALKLRENWWLKRAEMVDKAPIPIISVGNITVGGSGKTPVVERLACLLRARGYRPSIVLRGYGRKKKGVFTVDPLRDNHETVGDEALMLARRTGLPVVVATRRIDGVREALSRCATDLTLLDDGFQVRDIKKDMEILVINARAAANTDLFPLGPLREPVSALGRADIVLINKGEPDDSVMDATAGIPLFRVRYRPLHLFCVSRDSIVHHGFLKKKRVTAFCGLGDNGPFFDLLRTLGADPVQEVEFDDHHRYTSRDMERLLSCAGTDLLVTTEKDAVKLEGLDIPENLFYLAIEAEIEREDELIDQIVKSVKGEPCKTDC